MWITQLASDIVDLGALVSRSIPVLRYTAVYQSFCRIYSCMGI